MHYIVKIITFAFVVKTIRCSSWPVVNLKMSKTFQKMSTTFTGINNMFNTLDELYNIKYVWEDLNKQSETEMTLFRNQLTIENHNYITIYKFTEANIFEIQSILVNLFKFEEKAIICRGMRYILPIIKYSIFINDILIGSSEPNNKSKTFKKKSYISVDEKTIRSKSNNNEHYKNFKTVNFKNSGIKQVEENIIADASILIGIIEKIKTIIDIIEDFIVYKQKDYIFLEISQIIMNILSTNAHSCRNNLLLIYSKINNNYNTGCVPGSNETMILRKFGKQIKRTNYKIPQLVEKIDKYFIKLKTDFKLLSIKFNPTKIQFQEEVFHWPMIFYHLFSKLHNPEVWELIGNEMIVDVNEIDSPKIMSLSDVILREENSITKIISNLILTLKKCIKCRYFIYMKLILKLYYSTVRALIMNVDKIRLLIKTETIRNYEKFREYEEKVLKNNVNTMTENFNNYVFDFIHGKISQYYIDGMHNNIFSDFHNILLTVDELNRQDMNAENELKTIFVIYLKRIMYSMNRVTENISFYLMDTEIDTDFDMKHGSILHDIEETSINLNRKTVKILKKWYQWAEQMSTNCFSDKDYKSLPLISTFDKTTKKMLFMYSKEYNDETKINLRQIINSMDYLTSKLEHELYNVTYF